MRILGVDPGFTSGYAIIEDNKIIIAGEFKVSKTQRLASLFNFYMSIIQEYNPDICIIENSYVNNNAKTSLLLGQSKGVIELTFQLNNKDYLSLAPCQIKKLLLHRGNCKKSEVQEYINNLYNTKYTHNTTDAIAISLCYYLI